MRAFGIRRWMRHAVVGLVAAAAAAAFGTAAAQPALPNGFAMQSVALGPFASQPTAFALLPDGRVLITERATGNVQLASTTSTASVVIATIPNVTSIGERGLLGIAVDPAWPARPYVYFHSTQVGNVIQITMYTATGDLTDPTSTNLALGNPYLLLADIPDLASTHNGGTLRFGADGFLYVSVGDDVRACEAQNIDSPRGKILRLDVSQMPGTGSGPPLKSALAAPGNPFTGSGWQPLVYAYGFRNPFRFTIDSLTGNLYIGDVGELTWEELDELVQAGYTGQDFGWPEFEGPLQDPLAGATDCSTPPFTPPIHVYPNPPNANVAVICGPLYRTSANAPYVFPKAYEGSLFFVDFYAGAIQRLAKRSGGWAIADSVPGQPSASYWATTVAQISDLQLGPDGALYLSSFGVGPTPQGILRIVNTLPSDVEALAPQTMRMWASPNPSRRGAGVTFHLQMTRTEDVRVRIYDVAGRLVSALSPPASRRGAVRWDGRERGGARAAPGIYVYRARTASGARAEGKIVLTE